MAFEMQNFNEDVLEASRATPILVDFWAPWCGPCRVLGPVLERLAAEAGDRWRLVKINTDEHPEISMQYGIRGIPAVKLFAEGTVVAEFTGALPEYAVKQWLEEVLPSEEKARLESAQAAIDAGQDELAESMLNDVLATDADNAKARTLLARLVVLRDPDRAIELLEGTSPADPNDAHTAAAVRELARVLTAHDATDLPDGPGRDAFREGLEALQGGDMDTAVARMIDVIQKDRYYQDDAARKLVVALFSVLGEHHDVTRKHRRTFDTSLY